MKKRYLLLLIIPAIAFLHGCFKDDLSRLKAPTWKPDIAVPLVNSSLTIKDMLNKYDTTGFINIDSTNFLSLAYKADVFSADANSLLTFNDVSTSKSFQLTPVDIVAFQSIGNITKFRNDTLSFTNSNGATIDHVIVKTGKIHVSLTSEYLHTIKMQVYIPGCTKNSVPLQLTANLTYTGTTPILYDTIVDVAGYILDMTLGGAASNSVILCDTITLINSGNAIQASEQAKIDVNVTGLSFSYVDGYLGQLPFALDSDTVAINLDLFKNVNIGNVSLEDPKLNIYIDNSIGIPVSLTFSKLEANSKTNGIVPFTGPNFPGPFIFNYPLISEIGQTKTTLFAFNKGNSNIFNMVNIAPQSIVYNFSAKSNPNGKSVPNFVTDSSKFKVGVEAVIPLYGSVSNLTFQDTIDINLGNAPGEIQSFTFKIGTDNGFPLDVKMQVYFADTNFVILDSLMINSKYLLMSGLLDANNKVVTPRKTITTETIADNRIQNVTSARKLIISAGLETTNKGTQPVKFYSDYSLGVHIGVRAKLKLDAGSFSTGFH